MLHNMLSQTDTIVALSTAQGLGAIAVIRLSGEDAIRIVNACFKGKNLEKQASHTLHVGLLCDGEEVVDEVVVGLFIAPKSYTKENVVEISCHGSPYVAKRIIELLIRRGARYAEPGEFTKRAFLNGQLDLAQAEAVADLIHSESEAARKMAIQQMRGGFSRLLKELRQELIDFAALIELELDFSEEDVEFANREKLKALVNRILNEIEPLINSFALGNVLKNGVPTVIAGKPNAGKSTLLNALLNEEKAIVSSIAGTTRDVIEDEILLDGIRFRFIDTAGLRETNDSIEAIGVERTKEKIKQASLLLYLVDLSLLKNTEEIEEEMAPYLQEGLPSLCIGSKADLASQTQIERFEKLPNSHILSVHKNLGLNDLKQKVVELVSHKDFNRTDNTLVSNARHYEALLRTKDALLQVLGALDIGISGELLAQDLRMALHHLGAITGQVSTEDLLDSIFTRFCIGK